MEILTDKFLVSLLYPIVFITSKRIYVRILSKGLHSIIKTLHFLNYSYLIKSGMVLKSNVIEFFYGQMNTFRNKNLHYLWKWS